MITDNQQKKQWREGKYPFKVICAITQPDKEHTVFLYTDTEVPTEDIVTYAEYAGQQFYITRSHGFYLEGRVINGRYSATMPSTLDPVNIEHLQSYTNNTHKWLRLC